MPTVGEWRSLWRTEQARAADILLSSSARLAQSVTREAGLAPSDADDVASASMCAILANPEAADRAAPQTPFDAWLRGVMTNIAMQARRKRERAEGERALARSDEERHLSAAITRNEILTSIGAAARSAMTGRQSHAVSIWLEGIPFSMIGARLSVGRGRACQLVRHGLEAARRAARGEARSMRTVYPDASEIRAESLTPRERTLLDHARRGRSVSEIAQLTQVSTGTARSALHRLRKQLLAASPLAPNCPPPRASEDPPGGRNPPSTPKCNR